MHIEPGIVTGAKLILSYATAAGALSVTSKIVLQNCRKASGLAALLLRSLITTALVLCFFQALPHPPVGVSEVHLILGTTLFLLFGAAPAAVGLAAGLLIQGLFFAPFDLPQYGMNVTTLLVPLFAIDRLARRIIAPNTRYADITYKQALTLSVAYQGGIVSWVAVWSFYGYGVSWHTLTALSSFGVAYMSVVLIEPLIDLGMLAVAKTLRHKNTSLLLNQRLYWS